MHTPAPFSHTLSVPSITHVHYFSLGRPPAVCVGPRHLLSGTHRSIYLSSQVCLPQTHTSPLLFSPVMPPYVQYGSMQVHTPAPLFIDHILAHSSPLDMVGLSHHLLAALSPPVCLSGPYLLLSAFWERGSPDLPACGLRRGSKGGPARPIFINTDPRPSQGAKPPGADDTKLPQAWPHQAGS